MEPKLFLCIVAISLSVYPVFAEDMGSISSGETRSGSISVPGEQDTWTFTASARDDIILSVHETSGELYTGQCVDGPDGSRIWCYRGSRFWRLGSREGGTYKVTVYDGQSDSYDNAAEDTGEYNITFLNLSDSSWPTISCDQTRSGSIDAVTDAEVWKFPAVIYEHVLISAVGTSGNLPDISVFAPDGRREAHDDLLINRHVGQTGTYTVMIDGSTGAYNITFLNVDDCSGSTISCNETRSGSIDATSDMDIWQFFASDGDHLSIRVVETSGSLYPYVILYAPDHGGEKGAYRSIDWDATRPGTYTVVVYDGQTGAGDTGLDDTGGYEITVTCGSGVSTCLLNASSTAGGSVTVPGEGPYAYTAGSSVSVVATAEAGYKFTGWSGTAVTTGKVANPSAPSTTVTMDGDYTLVANFAIDQRTLTVASTQGGSVTTPGEGAFSYSPGSVVPVAAVAESDHLFTRWTGTAVDAGKVGDPTSPNTTVTVDADYTLTANFRPVVLSDPHTVTISSTDGGFVSAPGEGEFQYEKGTIVSIAAKAHSGYLFENWTGTAVDAGKVEDPTSPSTTVTVDTDCTLTANFRPVAPSDLRTVTISSTDGGSVSVPGEGEFQYEKDAIVSITAKADAGYLFLGWTGTAVVGGKVANPASPTTTVRMDDNYTLCAGFGLVGQTSVLVLAPNGGESLAGGSTVPVRWEIGGPIEFVTIELSVDGGSTWTQLARCGAEAGTWNWTIPSINADHCLLRISAAQNTSLSDTSNVPFSIHGMTRYVDTAATGKNDGTTWQDAFVHLQDALAGASAGDAIWVTEGLYWPDLGAGYKPGSRAATFQLKNGVAIYGGFPAGGGTWPQRNPVLHKSILSGDIGKIGVANDNSYHVVTGSYTEAVAVFDGFVITGGYAYGEDPDDRGGGMYNQRANCVAKNCMFVGNAALFGGAVYNNQDSAPTFVNCAFSGNTAGRNGGAVYTGPMTAINCTFTANHGRWQAGGVFGSITATNCIFWGNSRTYGTAYDQLGQLTSDPAPVVNYCCIQGGAGLFGGEGNIGKDPLFVDADGPDDIPGTPDDDLRLRDDSPCIDAGDSAAVPADLATDLQGQPRISGTAVDIGAYESGGVAEQ